MEKLSVVIITLNEERNIGRCLASVSGLADEVLVIDSFSNDSTEEICLAAGARFEKNPFAGYIEQKTLAISRASYPYVLSLDADEALSAELKSAVLAEKSLGFPAKAYQMNRLTNYCGKWIFHCGWYPDRKIRLYHRDYARIEGQNPHDKVVATPEAGKVVQLQGDLLHYSYYEVSEHYRQADRFATIAAKALLKKGKKSSYALAAMKTVAKFVRNYLIKHGFLDGRAGLTICRISALETWWKYSRLIHFQQAAHDPNQ